MDADILALILERISDLKEQGEGFRRDSIREHQETRRAVGALTQTVHKQNGQIGKAHRRIDQLDDVNQRRRIVNDRRWTIAKRTGGGMFALGTVVAGIIVQHLIAS